MWCGFESYIFSIIKITFNEFLCILLWNTTSVCVHGQVCASVIKWWTFVFFKNINIFSHKINNSLKKHSYLNDCHNKSTDILPILRNIEKIAKIFLIFRGFLYNQTTFLCIIIFKLISLYIFSMITYCRMNWY